MVPQYNAILSLLFSIGGLLLIATIPSTHSRAIDPERGAFHGLATTALLSDYRGKSDNETQAHSRSLAKRALNYAWNADYTGFIVTPPVDWPSTQQVKDEAIRFDVLATTESRQYFYTVDICSKCKIGRALFPDGLCYGWSQIVQDERRWLAHLQSALIAVGFASEYKAKLLVSRIASQAFAEEARGDVYIFTRRDQEPGAGWVNANDNTWVGWEYPALTRNPKVKRIIRIDPRPGQNPSLEIIWRQGDPPSAQVPRGADVTVESATGGP